MMSSGQSVILSEDQVEKWRAERTELATRLTKITRRLALVEELLNDMRAEQAPKSPVNSVINALETALRTDTGLTSDEPIEVAKTSGETNASFLAGFQRTSRPAA